MKLIIQSLPGTWWDEFDSNIFSRLLLHTFLIHFSVPGSRVLTLRVVHSNLRQMLVDKEDFDIGLSVLLLQCERCQSSQCDQDIVPRHQSIHGSFWVSLCCESSSHLSHIDAYSRLFLFEQPFGASLALAWCTTV